MTPAVVTADNSASTTRHAAPQHATPVREMAGYLQTSRLDGTAGDAAMVETTNTSGFNSTIQFSVNNSGVGATAQKLRIGSVAGVPDVYANYGLTSSAADNNIITDQNGVGCKAVQGFSALSASKGMVIAGIKFITADASVQLNQPVRRGLIKPDGSVDYVNVNIASTQRRDDTRNNLVERRGPFVIDAMNFLEYNVLGGESVDIFLELSAMNVVECFVELATRI